MNGQWERRALEAPGAVVVSGTSARQTDLSCYEKVIPALVVLTVWPVYVGMVIIISHLSFAAIWLGSMIYSLTVVQPRVERFFSDRERREEFFVMLANGNRWPVVTLIAALLLTDLAVLVVEPEVRLGYGIAFLLYVLAGALFVHVSWRHWPARVFALAEELPGFQRRLRQLAWMMLGLVGAAFLMTLSVSLGVST